MTARRRLTAFLVCLTGIGAGSSAMGQAKDGAVLGGVAGAVIGGIVGHQNDETPEGALIGGAVGAIAGGLIGNQRRQQQQIQYYQQQSRYQQPYCHHPTYVQVQPTPVYTTPVYTTPVYATQQTYVVPSRPVVVRRAVTVHDVITLTRNRISETVIANHIRANGIAAQPSIDDVLAMSDAGVSDFVISEMQNAPLSSSLAAVAGTTTQPSSVIVQEEVYTPIDSQRPISNTRPSSSYPRSSQLQPVPAYRQKF